MINFMNLKKALDLYIFENGRNTIIKITLNTHIDKGVL